MTRKDTNKVDIRDLADSSGAAIVVLDEAGSEVSSNNNNSMCRNLYSSREFGPSCAEYCGRALERAAEAGRTIEYRCYAGLDCRGVLLRSGEKRLVAIVGRTFTKSEHYRSATERAITGDWQNFPPGEFFDNVLIGGSEARLDKAARKLQELSPAQIEARFAQTHDHPFTNGSGTAAAPAKTELSFIKELEVMGESFTWDQGAARSDIYFPHDEVAGWRSLFGTMLRLDYPTACQSIIDFVSTRYGLLSLVWLELKGTSFLSRFAIGNLAGRTISLQMEARDEQFLEAARSDVPLVIREERRTAVKKQTQTLSLFPIVIGGEVKSVLGIGEALSGEAANQIARFCRFISSQVEILRLRHEVERRDTVNRAVKKFNDAVAKLDSTDIWQHLTRVSAELLQAERASLLARKEGSAQLEIVGSIGLRNDLLDQTEIGARIAVSALEKRSPRLVRDVGELALGPVDPGVKYNSSSFISYPIAIADNGLAILNLSEKIGGGEFNEGDLEVLHAIVPQMAVAIDRVTFKEQAGAYAQLSVTDSLTGLSNRRYLEMRLTEEIQRSFRHGFAMSFMMLDVDKFKSYNDKFGHPAGDEALKLVGLILRDVVRGEDVAARYGGEEFAILLPQTGIKEAETIAERIRERIEETSFPYRKVTVSIGLSTYSSELSSMADIISASDKALYEAKRLGRNNVRSYTRLDGTLDNIH